MVECLTRDRGAAGSNLTGVTALSLSKNINPSLVLVQPRKTCPFITEILLMGRKESNQTKSIRFKGQVRVFAGRVKIVSHFSCRTSAILKYFLSPHHEMVIFSSFLCKIVPLLHSSLITLGDKTFRS